ncbi:MAG TPA: GTPase Era [Bacteroidales bacterium]|nr:GTPase Era [Bacteroidales bacterium]
MNTTSTHKAGFVNIVGNPNVGKSTIMNRMVGEKLSIITSKAQTTRHRIHGIVNGDDFQIVYSDTPGILTPKYKLQENMLKAARSALVDADILIYVTDVTEEPGLREDIAGKLQKSGLPVILVLNKVDLCNQEKVEQLFTEWSAVLPDAGFVPMSATEGFNLDRLFNLILEKLPENPPFYSKDLITDKSERFFAGEIIREKILLFYQQEIPYSVEIEIEEFKDTPKIIRIRTVIYVERDTQKGILIGKAGSSLKKTGTEARKEMEKFFGKKVFLELFVKVRKDWRNNDRMLKSFGYR